MIHSFSISVYDILPEKERMCAKEHIASRASPVFALLEEAEKMFLEAANPSGLWEEIAIADFATVYRGEGKNEPENPVGMIFPQATSLALFAATIGASVGDEIRRLFSDGDCAAGYMLDSLASEAVENTADVVQEAYTMHLRKKEPHTTHLQKEGMFDPQNAVLRYSPGYCGWDISGQKKLFETLKPERTGITLTSGFLMIPLKSISGVMIDGAKQIHRFVNDYPFCRRCKTFSCRDRIARIQEKYC